MPHAPSCTSITVLPPNYLRQVHGTRSVSKVRVVHPTIRVPFTADRLRPKPDTLRRRGNRRRQPGNRTRNARHSYTFLFSKRTDFMTRSTLPRGPLRSGWSRRLALKLPFAVIKKEPPRGDCRKRNATGLQNLRVKASPGRDELVTIEIYRRQPGEGKDGRN